MLAAPSSPLRTGYSPSPAPSTIDPEAIHSHKPEKASVFAGSKIPHLKKPDGEPLYRKDVQFDFLSYIFSDQHAAFTSPFTHEKLTFLQLYMESFRSSAKCSKVLRDRIAIDERAAKSIAMVSLLVNVGRINTTLTFFYEMRAALRTYHPIPCLQLMFPQDRKNLQDAPRLKSILKAMTEDQAQPQSYDQLVKSFAHPTTNPMSLLFIFSNYAPKLTEAEFSSPREFYDLFTRSTLSSESRGNAFLYLVWKYLEKNGPDENPFEFLEAPIQHPKIAKKPKRDKKAADYYELSTPTPVTPGDLDQLPTAVRSSSRRKRKIVELGTQEDSDIETEPTQAEQDQKRQRKIEKRYKKLRLRDFKERRRERKREGALLREWRLVSAMDPLDDSEREKFNDLDNGEEAEAFLAALRRGERRGLRWRMSEMV
ncbi:Ino eighty subunit 1 [Neolecta irregularis DAH-3]|uniref:Ino eighty subunit 1 n=1 Tax=Neolecta irregularis (strain DAH-3) TaxID=1198029 RepID=A0A1U7LS30_NEOID|nr:Ino eighty subunit 1 [Neolecta irregularis DAH-3]|eukprot:OLL25475.1 Ino eighty subunit 1 [Neolecta irregularis DAH-3]